MKKLPSINKTTNIVEQLKAGFVTSATSAGADVFRLMDEGSHRNVGTVRGYVRRAEMFKHHAGAGFM